MFSLISLYFAYRRDVVVAERYVAGLSPRVAAPATALVAAAAPVVAVSAAPLARAA